MLAYDHRKEIHGPSHKKNCRTKRTYYSFSEDMKKEIYRLNTLCTVIGERLTHAYLCYNCDQLHIGRGEKIKV